MPPRALSALAASTPARDERLPARPAQLMCAARFHILTNEEWELAKADTFMVALPVEGAHGGGGRAVLSPHSPAAARRAVTTPPCTPSHSPSLQ